MTRPEPVSVGSLCVAARGADLADSGWTTKTQSADWVTIGHVRMEDIALEPLNGWAEMWDEAVTTLREKFSTFQVIVEHFDLDVFDLYFGSGLRRTRRRAMTHNYRARHVRNRRRRASAGRMRK